MGRVIPPHFQIMKQPDKRVRQELSDIQNDRAERISIRDTKRHVKVRGMKPYTIERLTALWVARDLARCEDSGSTLHSLCRDPYFNHKQAALIVLNGWFRIKFFWGLLWRWWAYVREYEEYQLTDIIVAGKKKIPLTSYWTNIALTVDMRNDWITMTNKEAEQYRAELLLVAERHSSKSTPSTEG